MRTLWNFLSDQASLKYQETSPFALIFDPLQFSSFESIPLRISSLRWINDALEHSIVANTTTVGVGKVHLRSSS